MIEGADSYDMIAGMARAIFGESRHQFSPVERITAERALAYAKGIPVEQRVGISQVGIE